VADHVTTNFQIHVPAFADAPWHATLTTAIDRIDAIMYGVAVVVGAPLWQNSKAYVKGNLAFDGPSATTYFCEVAHTSAAGPTIFATDRTNHPTYWTAIIPTV
jgi:hypothetical protein